MLSYYIHYSWFYHKVKLFPMNRIGILKSIKIPPSLQDPRRNRKLKGKSYSKRVYKTTYFCFNKNHKQLHDHGSATVEATLILPIFIMTALIFYLIGNLLQVRLMVYDAMQDTVQYLAECQYVSDIIKDDNESAAEISDISVSIPAVKAKMLEFLAESPIDDSYIAGGSNGIMITRSSYSDADNCINVKLRYKLKIEVPVFGSLTWNVNEQVRQKAFTGMLTDITDDPDQAYVYITSTGEVYHSSRNCYHIRLTIRQIDEQMLENSYSALAPCELCAEDRKTNEDIYVTETGDKFHYSVSCSGLKRTVMRVKKKEAGTIPACSNCGS